MPSSPVCDLVQLGTRHILEAMTQAGHDIRTLFFCGGLSKNPLFVQVHANATGTSSAPSACSLSISHSVLFTSGSSEVFLLVCLLVCLWLPGLPVVLPDQAEAVLLGAAVLGACASQDYSSVQVSTNT